MGCLVVALTLGSGLPAKIGARPHDPRDLGGNLAGGELAAAEEAFL
jgi:hypothetical protein